MKIKHSIIILISVISLIAVNNSSALTYQNDTNIDFTINPTISMTLSGDLIIDNLTPGSSSDSNIIEVGVSTNASHGYYLSATVGSSNTDTNLTNSENSNYKFTNLSSNASSLSNFNDNEWGYSYSTDGGTNWVSGSQGSTSSGYNGLPLDGNDSGVTGITLIDTTTPLATNQVKFKIGAKASNTQASGTYTNTINFYAVTHQASLYMQYVSSSTLATLMPNVNDSTILYDIRDNQEYTVAKLADGKYWMTKNLNIAGGTALSSNDTDVDRVYIDNFTTSNNLTKANNTIVLPESSTTGFNAGNYSFVYNSENETDNCSAPGCYSYYSWDAATLGSGRIISTDDTDAPYSICPKGWRLPTSGSQENNGWKRGDFYKLATAYGVDLSNTFNSNTTAFYDNAGPNTTPDFLLTGLFVDNEFDEEGTAGRCWSSTSYGTTTIAYDLVFLTNYINSASYNFRRLGLGVRCLFRE